MLRRLGNEFQLHTNITGAQKFSAVTALKDGGFAGVWSSNGPDGSSEGIYLQRFKDNGDKVGPERLINATTDGSQTHPDLTHLANGDLIVVWDTPDGAAVSDDNITGRLLNKLGAPKGSEIDISTVTVGNQHNPHVTAFAGGGFIVTWTGADANGFGGFGQRFKVNGFPVGNEFQINTHTTETQFRPVVAEINGGGFWSVWQSFGQDGSANGIYAQRFSKKGDPLGSEFLVNQTFSGDQSNADITTLNDGRILITWQSTGTMADDDSYGILGRLFDPKSSATPLGDEFPINEITDGTQSDASVKALPDGGFALVWTDSELDGSSTSVVIKRFDANGKAVGASEVVNTFIQSIQSDAEVEVLANGGLVVSWTSIAQDGSSDGVYAQQFKPALYGTNGKDLLIDKIGTNWMDGRSGNDTLLGRSGKDEIRGGKGNDTIDGGKGKDVLVGNNGADVFVFKKGYGKDKIRDFKDDKDTIQLDDALWVGTLTKQQVVDQYAAVAGNDILFDFGKNELTIKGFNDLNELKDDLDII